MAYNSDVAARTDVGTMPSDTTDGEDRLLIDVERTSDDEDISEDTDVAPSTCLERATPAPTEAPLGSK